MFVAFFNWPTVEFRVHRYPDPDPRRQGRIPGDESPGQGTGQGINRPSRTDSQPHVGSGEILGLSKSRFVLQGPCTWSATPANCKFVFVDIFFFASQFEVVFLVRSIRLFICLWRDSSCETLFWLLLFAYPTFSIGKPFIKMDSEL